MALRIKHRDSVNYASGYAAFHTLKTRFGGQTTPDFEQVTANILIRTLIRIIYVCV